MVITAWPEFLVWWSKQPAVCIDCGEPGPPAGCGLVQARPPLNLPSDVAVELARLVYVRRLRRAFLALHRRIEEEGPTATLRAEVGELLAQVPPELRMRLGAFAELCKAATGVTVIDLPSPPEA